jgi:hypothetical protein
MHKVMVITALAASLMVSTAVLAAPANLAGAIAPDSALTLVRGGVGAGGGHIGGGGGGGEHVGGIGGPRGGAGAHFEAEGHFENYHLGEVNPGHWRNNRVYPGGLVVNGGDYGPSYAGSCSWLRREAIATGSPYWWRRYQACL